jgi:hypothetical protein
MNDDDTLIEPEPLRHNPEASHCPACDAVLTLIEEQP